MDESRAFRGVWIPAEVYLDERLSALEKIILVEIDSLSPDDGSCFASNEYLSAFCQCSTRKVSDAITKLISLGYVEQVSFDGRKRVLRSCLAKTASLPSKNCEADTQNLRGFIYKSNNIANNIDESERDEEKGGKRFAETDKPYRAAKWLSRAIMERMPKRKPITEDDLQRWAGDIDKLHRIDGYDDETISDVLIFSQRDAFWQSNILSGKKFREKFVTLMAHMERDARKQSND